MSVLSMIVISLSARHVLPEATGITKQNIGTSGNIFCFSGTITALGKVICSPVT